MNITALKRKRAGIYMCVGCGSQIQDQYILRVAPDLEWHATCLRCADCNQYLDESCTCFVRDGKTYCKQDYVRLFGTKCAKCFGTFSRNDFVMRAKNKIFHIDCFRCTSCCRQLVPGDEFTIRDDRLFCKADGDLADQCSDKDDKMSVSSFDNDKKPNIHGERANPRKSKDHKTTRVRTVLNEKQLHTLRTCYGANPRPDALMKEQLVEMTNLSPRVIRVWFQNKRCKDKKRVLLLKQLQEQQEKRLLTDQELSFQNGQRLAGQLHGVPMVATSPVRHEGIQQQPVEVQQYQAPWKALSEFAMQQEMEQPPFQQLVNSFVDTSDDDDTVVMTRDMCAA